MDEGEIVMKTSYARLPAFVGRVALVAATLGLTACGGGGGGSDIPSRRIRPVAEPPPILGLWWVRTSAAISPRSAT